MNLCTLLLVLWGTIAISNRILRSARVAPSWWARVISQVFTFSALWVCLRLLGVYRETPDLMLTAVVLASALSYLRLFDGASGVGYFSVFTMGICGAAGYYLKQSYLPVALLFLVVLAWPPARLRIRLARVSVASAAFVLLILPWMAGLSEREGHPTMGGNSKFNYFVNVENEDPIAALFTILPPQNRLAADPTVVDFGSTFPHSQFPMHFAGAAYLTNVPVHFIWKQQLNQSRMNYIVTFNLFRHKGPFAMALVLILVCGLCFRRLSVWSPWLPLMLISAAPFILYPLVHVEYRYLAPYLFLGGVSAWAWATSENPNIPRIWALLFGCCLLGRDSLGYGGRCARRQGGARHRLLCLLHQSLRKFQGGVTRGRGPGGRRHCFGGRASSRAFLCLAQSRALSFAGGGHQIRIVSLVQRSRCAKE